MDSEIAEIFEVKDGTHHLEMDILLLDRGTKIILVPQVATLTSIMSTISKYRVPQKYRLKVYGSEGHKNGANHILFLCMFFSTSGHLV